jgi:hypothetical protein
VLFCCHLWQSKLESNQELPSPFQSVAALKTDKLERSVEVSDNISNLFPFLFLQHDHLSAPHIYGK